jgi:hypothetical protein
MSPEFLAARYGVVVVAAVIGLLVVEELARAYGGRAAARSRWLAVAIVPALVLFLVVLYGRVRGGG